MADLFDELHSFDEWKLEATQRWLDSREACGQKGRGAGCGKGQYQNQGSAVHCKPCGTGTFQNGLGTTACKDCPAGWIQASAGHSQCSQCSSGTNYQGSAGATACSDGSGDATACNTGVSTSVKPAPESVWRIEWMMRVRLSMRSSTPSL